MARTILPKSVDPIIHPWFPGEMTAVALVKKQGRLWVMRRLEIKDGVVMSMKDTDADSRDMCLIKAEEALLDATDE